MTDFLRITPPAMRRTHPRADNQCRSCRRWTRAAGACPGLMLRDPAGPPACHHDAATGRMQSPFELVPVFDADNGPGYGVRLAGGQTQFWGLSRISDSPRILAAVALDPEGARRSQPGAAGPQTTSISTVAQPRAAGPQTTVNSGGVTT